VPAILQFISGLNSDVLVLTEFRPGPTGLAICDELQARGYTFQVRSSEEKGRNSVLTVSRVPASIVDPKAGPPGYEHCLSLAQVQGVMLCACYFPQGERKRAVFNRILALVGDLQPLGLVIGDLNTGLPFKDEAGRSFKCVDGFQELTREHLVDAWRVRNPVGREYSWFSAHGNGFRIDHALATAALHSLIRQVEYDHATRERGITDHSALVVSF
jgi:exonuclease III